MSEERPPEAPRALSGRTAWARNLETPLRLFLRTETGSAVVLVGAAVAALVWINLSASSYAAVWEARLSVRLAGAGVSLSLRGWVNSGLMTFFFFVFGLEARREFDMGELRQRRRLALPVAAGLGGLVVPVAIYLAVNHGSAARGWGAAMSTDTAFALGLLALTRPRFPDRVRAFLLSVAVVDDLVSLVVIGTAYSQAEPVLRELLAGHGDVRYVWRHLPLTDVHPDAQRAAEAAEAAADQGAFWPMHDLLLRHQDALLTPDLVRYATEVGIDPERFRARLASRADAARIAEDVDSADLSGVSGTPTFFINGRRHYGSYDITELTAAVRAAKAASLASAAPPTPRR